MARIVGIFSRSDKTEYAWLMDQLGECCEVLPLCITNNNRHELIQCSNRCQSAIVHHTKNRGRINITDVTDSLYDSEIDLLFERHGKRQVLVVIDDLEDSSEEIKQSILSSQPTLRTKAHDIFLFTKREKQDMQILREKIQPIIDVIQGAKHTEKSNISHENKQGKEESTEITPWIHSTLHWTMTVVSLINTYYRRTFSNASLSFWLIASLIVPRNRFNLNRRVLETMGYSLVLYSFWKGRQMPNTTKLPEISKAEFSIDPGSSMISPPMGRSPETP